MKLWLDCEFNDFGGELISLAMVDERGDCFYAALPCPSPSPWVAANVMPVIGVDPMTRAEMQQALQAWLSRYDRIHIVADWPEDIAHYCRALITGPGQRIDTPPTTMEIRRDLSTIESAVPHNALADAKALRQMATAYDAWLDSQQA